MGSLAMKCIKYLLFLFNFLFALSGLLVIVVGVLIINQHQSFRFFVDDQKLITAQGIFILVGVFIFVVAFFGCCGAINENNYMLITFSVLLVLIFVLEAAAGVVCYVLKDDLLQIAESTMNDTLKSYKSEGIMKKTWDVIQYDYACCGLRGPDDWDGVLSFDTLPHNCCHDLPIKDICTKDQAYEEGCFTKLKLDLERKSFFFAYCGIGIAILQFIGVFFACHLTRSIHRNETV